MGASESAQRVVPLRGAERTRARPRVVESPGPRHVLQVLQPDRGGVPAYVDNLTRGLLRRGWNVTLAGPPGSAAVERATRAGANLVPLVLPRSPHVSRDPMAVARLVRTIRSERIDVVHAHSSKAGVLGAWAARITGCASVYSPHAWAFQMQGSLMTQSMYAAIERTHNYLGRDRIVLVSLAERAAAERWSICPSALTEVVHTGIPIGASGPSRMAARRTFGIGADQFVAAWVGRGSPQKRPQDVTPLQEQLAGAATMLVLGDGIEGRLGAQFEQAGGVCAPAGTPVSAVYAAADVLVHTGAWEGFPLVVLEALQVGLPVVAYAVGGIMEQVIDTYNGYLVDRGDVRALAGCVRHLAVDVSKRARMSLAARELAEAAFDYDHMVAQVERVYDDVYAARMEERVRLAGSRPSRRGAHAA